MKRFILAGILICSVVGKFSATVYTWTATSASNANNSSNWSPSGVPGSGDDVIFDGTSTANCSWDIAAVRDFSVLSGYTGSVTMTSGGKSIRRHIVINSGTVVATPGTLTRSLLGIAAVFSVGAGGTFDANGGTFLLQLDAFDNYTFSGDISLATFIIGPAFTSGERAINFGSNLTATNVSYQSITTPDPVSYQGTIHVKSSFDISASTNTDAITGTNNANFIFDGSSLNLTGSSSAGMAFLPNIEMNVSGNYTLTNHLNITGNWTGTQGTLTSGSSTQNFYGSSATVSGAAVQFNNLNIQSGASVSLPGAQEVKVAGSITRTGTLTIPSSMILGLNGSTQSLSSPGYVLAGLRLYTPSSGSQVVTLNTTVDISDFVEVPANSTLASGSGNLRLKATSSGSARVASLFAGGLITGSVTVETYLPGPSTGWANLGVRGVMGQTVKSWDTYSASAGANGIPMTCNGCDYDENALGSHFVSIQDYTEATGAYGELTGSSALNPGQGYWTYVGNGTSSTSDLMVINTGSLVQGQQNINCTNAGTPFFDGFENLYYNLVANPYASPILWSNVFNNGATTLIDFEDGIYAWNADLVGGTGDFAVYKNSISSGGLTDVIPGGQGFYVGLKEFPVSTFLEFHEYDKVTSSGNDPVLKPATSNTISLFRLKLQGPYSEETETVIRIEPTATPFYDNKFDAHKMFMTPGYVGYQGPYTKYTTISTKDGFDVDYAINAIPPLTQSVSIPVLARVAYNGTFNISVFDIQNFNPDICIGLIDKLDNSYHDLRNGAYSFGINDTTSIARFELVLCKDNSINTTSISEEQVLASNVAIGQNQDGAFVRTAFPLNTKATISAYNLMGQKIMDDVHIEGTTTNTRLNLNNHGQVVFITVNTPEGSTRKKMLLN
ncbi:MAG: hypothetical protein JNL60_10230 [Bacteroidia bacterium]|nr:hypothetical protein [Bacteroidia bacterium]